MSERMTAKERVLAALQSACTCLGHTSHDKKCPRLRDFNKALDEHARTSEATLIAQLLMVREVLVDVMVSEIAVWQQHTDEPMCTCAVCKRGGKALRRAWALLGVPEPEVWTDETWARDVLAAIKEASKP